MSDAKPPDGYATWLDFMLDTSDEMSKNKRIQGAYARTELAALRQRCEAAEKLAKDNEYAFDAKVEEFDQLAERLVTRTAERDAAQAWKDSQLLVESEWDPQKVGKLLGVAWGASIRRNIEPKIAELLTTNADLLAQRDGFQAVGNNAKKAMAALVAENERLRTALCRHGRHDDGSQGEKPCRSEEDGPETCDCGFDAAMERLREALKPTLEITTAPEGKPPT